VALDLNALIPILRRVLRKGFVEAGQDWMWGGNWGVRWPIRRVTSQSSAVRQAASGQLRCSASSPGIGRPGLRFRACVSAGRSLRFETRAGYLQMGMSEEVASGNAALIAVSRWWLCWCCWWWSS